MEQRNRDHQTTAVWTVLLVTGTVVLLLALRHFTARSRGHGAGVPYISAEDNRQTQIATIAKANDLRAQWFVWASRHKALLRDLVDGQQTDEKTLERVYAFLPPNQPLFTVSAPIPFPAKAPAFSWQFLSKQQEKVVSGAHERLRKNYRAFHDIALSESENIGPWRVTLWASGRVTKTSLVEQHVPGRPAFVETFPQEISPRFAFLKQDAHPEPGRSQ